jgi:cytolysin (calcineurin-like family phosphatase)
VVATILILIALTITPIAFGVIGPVNFSMSVGIIAANGNASRFSLIFIIYFL